MTPSSFAPALAALLVLSFTGGCGWVDATGVQADAEPPATEAPRAAPLASGDGVPVPLAPTPPPVAPMPLAPSMPLALLELTPRNVNLEGDDRRLGGWTWRILDEPGEIADCAAVEGFDAALAERRLGDACSVDGECELDVEERRSDGESDFRLTLPALRAPLAARVALSALDTDGTRVERRRTICGLSINEAPEALADRYTVERGRTLAVRADGGDGLLANDVDDDDVRNAPLAVSRTPARAPRHASLFELYEDGGFVYRAADGGDGELEDSFSYRVTDGVHEVVGEVVIAIGGGNRPPRATAPLPDIEIAVDALLPRFVDVDLSTRFVDPDGDALSFTVAPGSLPPGGRLAVDRRGRLSGLVGTADLGTWRVTLIVDDGRASIEQDFLLRVVRAFEANSAPTVTDIANRRVEKNFRYDVAPFFDDADGDPLSFSATGLPPGVAIDDSGVIEGRASKKKNRGTWFVVVTADDGRGGRVSDGFRLSID